MKNNIVYSTDNSFEIDKTDSKSQSSIINQNLRVHLDRRKAGKIVTIIKGFKGNHKKLEEYATIIKKKCGIGGSVKNSDCLLYTSPSPRDRTRSRMPSSA